MQVDHHGDQDDDSDQDIRIAVSTDNVANKLKKKHVRSLKVAPSGVTQDLESGLHEPGLRESAVNDSNSSSDEDPDSQCPQVKKKLKQAVKLVNHHRKVAGATAASALSILTMVIALIEFLDPDSDGGSSVVVPTPPPTPFIYAPNVREEEFKF